MDITTSSHQRSLESGRLLSRLGVLFLLAIYFSRKSDVLHSTVRATLETRSSSEVENLDLGLHNPWIDPQKTENKVYPIKRTLVVWNFLSDKNRHLEVLVWRLRIRHTRLTHGFPLNKQDAPVRHNSGGLLSVLHIMWPCPWLERKRRIFLPELFNKCRSLHSVLLLEEYPLVAVEPWLNVLHEKNFLRNIHILA